MDKQLQAKESVGWNELSIPTLKQLHRWSLEME